MRKLVIVATIGIGLANLAAPMAAAQERGFLPALPSTTTLALDVQKELYRLGCYEEAINGVWTASSRAAALKFLDRVNAQLPVDKPDEALLALLKSAKGFVCTQCPPGEAFNPAGRCVPKALVEKASKPALIATGSVSTDTSPTSDRPSTDGSREVHGTARVEGRSSSSSSGGDKYWRNMWRNVDRALGIQ